MITEIDDLKKQLNSKLPADALRAEKEAAALAEQGSLEAAEMLVSVYADGTDAIRADRIKEFKYTKIAAGLGSSFSRFWLANLQRQSDDYASALENARLAHEMGDSNATTLLARMMLAGEGQPAQPLEALALLSESVESGVNADAAVLLAEVYLNGKHIPRDAQNAYGVLHGMWDLFTKITRHVSPDTYARALYLKAEAIRLGAVPAAGETYTLLIGKAADAGDHDALNVRQGMKNETDDLERRADWEAASRFEAYGGKWKMFPNIGRLVRTDTKSHTSVSGTNGNISSFTSQWCVHHFQTDSGQHFSATTSARASLVTGRPYAVLYMGPENEDSGVATAIFDLTNGSVVKADGDIHRAYRQNTTNFMAALMGCALVFAVFIGIALLVSWGIPGMLWLGGVAFLTSQFRKKRRGGMDEAMRKAGYFFDKHRARPA